MLTITTLEKHRTESGLFLTLRQKQVAGSLTVYQVFGHRGRNDPHAGALFEGSYCKAVDCLNWWLDGCPC